MNLKKRILPSLVLASSIGMLAAQPVYAAKNTYPKDANPAVWQNKKVAFYVKPGRYHRELSRAVKKAVKQWNKYKVVHLSVTTNKKKAQVVVKPHLRPWRLLGQCNLMWIQNTNDFATFVTKGCYIDINVLAIHRAHWSVQPTVAHEVGHAIGIKGHSYDPNSVMYAYRTAKHHNGRILKSDVAELKSIYSAKNMNLKPNKK